MRALRLIWCGLIALLGVGTAHADDQSKEFRPPSATMQLLVKQLREHLPQGWSVSYDEGRRWIEIDRNRDALATGPVFNAPPDEKPMARKIWFALDIIPFMSREKYQELESDNEEIQKKLDEMAVKYGIRGLFGGDYGIAGHEATDEDRRHLAVYRTLAAKGHELPDFHFKDISLKWDPPQSNGWLFMPVDSGVVHECEDVSKEPRSKLRGILEGKLKPREKPKQASGNLTQEIKKIESTISKY
jgi:hypothetical protein